MDDCDKKYGADNLVEINVMDGIYVTGSFNLTSNIILHLNNDATLAGSTNLTDYGLCEYLSPCGTPMHCPLNGSLNSSNITIIGDDDYNIHNPCKSLSNIDGRREPWWYNFSHNISLKNQTPK